LLAAGVFLVVVVFGGSSSAPTVMAVNLVAMFLALAVTTKALSRSLPPALYSARSEYKTGMWGRVALPLMLATGMSIVLSQISIILVGVFVDTTEAGIYAVTNRVATAAVYGFTAIIYVASPFISELYSQGRRRELQRIITLATCGSLAFALLFFLGMVVFGKPVLGLFGPGFSEGYVALVVLSVGQLINALTGPVKNSMIMIGYQDKAVQMMGAGALLNVVLNVILIPLLGMQGAAIATVVATTTLNLAMAYWVQQRLGLKLLSLTPRDS
jgi:O-antigen/teichoic acid export membrane protein